MNRFSCRRRGVLAAISALAAFHMLPVKAAETEPVVSPIQTLVDGLIRVMKAGSDGASFAQRYEMLAPVIEQTFDLDTIIQESVGLTWGNLPADQQKLLEDAFRRYTVASYVNSFNKFKGQRFQINPDPHAVGNGEQVVETEIIPASGEKHQLDYVMRGVPDGWRVVDVLADGSVSRVAVQRSDFRSLLMRGGPQALAESLRNKSADLSQGAG
jgi:phospholipid transport system substrate-binding protein